jgi:tRNA pseudouridine38-40 synthase
MVRLIAGTMLQVGSGKISVDDFDAIIKAQDLSLSGKSVAACGLYFIDVAYPTGFLKEIAKKSLPLSAE